MDCGNVIEYIVNYNGAEAEVYKRLLCKHQEVGASLTSTLLDDLYG